MKDETLKKLYELSKKTIDKLVTPLILDYFRFESLRISEKGIVNIIENKLSPFKS